MVAVTLRALFWLYLAWTADAAQVKLGGLTDNDMTYTSNPVCLQHACVNPFAPGLMDIPRLAGMIWQCSPEGEVQKAIQFCKGAIDYEAAIPSGNQTMALDKIVQAQDSAASTMFFYHLSALGYDAWEYRRPNETDDVCVQSVYKLTCLSYFPKNQAGCAVGAQIPFLRPCRNACESYVNKCEVECCDMSTQCVFVHEGEDGSEQSGYYDAEGPSALCTGSGAGRLASPGALLLLLLGIQLSMFDSSDRRRGGSWSRHLLVALLLCCASSLQGCSLFIPSHRVPNWRKESDYLVRFESVPEGQPETAAVLNSCNPLNAQEGGVTEVCSGRGQCKPWSIQPLKVASLNQTVPVSALSFCECDYQWADPECRTRRRSQMKAFLLSLFLGPFGADRFYLGLWVSGCFKLATLGGLGVWWLFDIVRVGSAAVYTTDFKVAADLPHWLYLLIVVLVFSGAGLIFSLDSYGRLRHQKRRQAMQFFNDEETMPLKSPLVESNDPRDPWGGHRSAGYGSALPHYPNANAPLVLG
mmetsp:Transcript_6059/g.11047  ORF Transcript_6059/g.11047 Transcript_6059/m.11047 type:complete len:526 (+) Transcript_6059:69-1646(+)